MDTEKEGTDSKSCCSDKKECGCGGGRRGCGCGVKALLVLILVLLGGVIGYLAGSHCGGYHHMEMCPYTTPAATPVTK